MSDRTDRCCDFAPRPRLCASLLLRGAALLVIVGALFEFCSAAEALKGTATMKEAAIEKYRAQDSFAAIDALCAAQDKLAATKSFHEVMHHFYWKEKSLAPAVAFGRAGLQHGMAAAAAVEASDAKLAYELRSTAKGMAYDLASFTWDGWDEKGIVITESDLKLGLDAARTNLRLAVELKKGDLPLARAWWMLGAQQMSARDDKGAIESFEKSAKFAKAAQAEGEELLARGDAAIVRLRQSQGKEGKDEMEDVKTQLKKVKDGEFFIEQLDTAVRVFVK